jgi:hypothetical protein
MVDLPTYAVAKDLDKMFHKGGNIFTALSQGRQLDRKYIQTKIEITTKFAISHHLGQVTVGCSDKPNIHLVSPTATQAFEFLFLQYAKQFGLKLRRNIADLIQEERAFIGQLEAAKLLRDSSSECSLFVAKKLAFQKIEWNGGAVQLDKWAPAPRADIVNGTRDQLLAGAGFTLD